MKKNQPMPKKLLPEEQFFGSFEMLQIRPFVFFSVDTGKIQNMSQFLRMSKQSKHHPYEKVSLFIRVDYLTGKFLCTQN